MTKKDFKAIANIIRHETHYAYAHNGHGMTSIAIIANRIAYYCADTNPRFDADKFLTACGLSPNTGDNS